jgi:hypothetical protein
MKNLVVATNAAYHKEEKLKLKQINPDCPGK